MSLLTTLLLPVGGPGGVTSWNTLTGDVSAGFSDLNDTPSGFPVIQGVPVVSNSSADGVEYSGTVQLTRVNILAGGELDVFAGATKAINVDLSGNIGIKADASGTEDLFVPGTVKFGTMKTSQRWFQQHYFGFSNPAADSEIQLSYFDPASKSPEVPVPFKGVVDSITVAINFDGPWNTGTLQFVFRVGTTNKFVSTAFDVTAYSAAATLTTTALTEYIRFTGLGISLSVLDELNCQIITNGAFDGTTLDGYMIVYGFYDNT